MAEKILNWIKTALRFLSCITICFLAIIVGMQVVNRNFLDHSFTWVEELASIIMIYITYFGAAMATINNSNTRIDFFIRLLPKKIHGFFEVLDDVICIAFLFVIIKYAYIGMIKNTEMFTPALHLPLTVNYVGILLGCILMVIFYAIHTYLDFEKIRGKDKSLAEEALNR